MIASVQIGKVTSVVTKGTTPSTLGKSYLSEGIPFLRAQNVRYPFNLQGDLLYIDEQTNATLSRSCIQPKDVLITIAGTIGRSTVVPEDSVMMNCNQAVAIIRLDDQVDPYYLSHWLNSPYAHRQVRGSTVTATIPNLSLSQIKRLEIPIPPLPEQKRIAAILDKADSIRRKRQEAIALADTFLRSVFLKMFGDYILNPDNYTFRKLNDVAVGNGIKCGPFGTQLSKSEFCEIGIPLWGIKHVNSGFTLQTNEYVTPEKAQKLADYDIVPGDIVMTRKGTVGNCSVYPEHYNVGIMHSDLLRIRADSKKIDYIFLDSQLKYSRNVNAQLQRVSSGAIMAGINVSKLKNIEVFVPDIKIQKQYSEVVKKHTEFICRLSYFAQSANCCFSSLQQRAFRGDL